MELSKHTSTYIHIQVSHFQHSPRRTYYYDVHKIESAVPAPRRLNPTLLNRIHYSNKLVCRWGAKAQRVCVKLYSCKIRASVSRGDTTDSLPDAIAATHPEILDRIWYTYSKNRIQLFFTPKKGSIKPRLCYITGRHASKLLLLCHYALITTRKKQLLYF